MYLYRREIFLKVSARVFAVMPAHGEIVGPVCMDVNEMFRIYVLLWKIKVQFLQVVAVHCTEVQVSSRLPWLEDAFGW